MLSTFKLAPETIGDEYRAGGRIPLIIGRALTDRARKALKKGPTDLFVVKTNPAPKPRGRATRWPRRWSARPAACPARCPAGTSSRG